MIAVCAAPAPARRNSSEIGRLGKKAADDQFRPVRASYRADYALEVVQVDHTLADVIVVDEVYRQPIQRPWLTMAIDVASSAVAGLYLTLEAPSALSVVLALTHTVLPKDDWLREHGVTPSWPVHGLQTTVHVDNGREFHSRALERGCREYGIDLMFRPRRTPHYGGHIERLIGTFMGEIHLLPGTTFSNVQEKGSYDAEKTAVMTLRELERWLASQVIAYNSRRHRLHQRSPRTVYAEASARRSTPVVVPEDARRFCLDFLPFEQRMVRRDGIHLFNIRYFDNVLNAFAGLSKAKMLVKYDPRDLSRVFLQDPEGTYWDIPYADLQRPRITLWERPGALRSDRERLHQARDRLRMVTRPGRGGDRKGLTRRDRSLPALPAPPRQQRIEPLSAESQTLRRTLREPSPGHPEGENTILVAYPSGAATGQPLDDRGRAP